MSILYHSVQQLTLFPTDNAPLKKCSRCPNSYPATTEYFHPNKSYADGLNVACRECRKEITRRSATKKREEKYAREGHKPRRRARIITLTCAQCGIEFQRTQEMHHKSQKVNKTGRFFCSPHCAGTSCGSPIEDEYLNSTAMKRCPTCPDPEENKWHPATPEYFYRSNATKDKLNIYCKKCQDEQTRKARGHGRKTTTWVNLTCAYCGREYQREAGKYNTCKRNNRSGQYFCSKTCFGESLKVILPPSIKEEYIAGATSTELAEKYHVSMSFMCVSLVRMDTPIRENVGGEWDQERRDKAAHRTIERISNGDMMVSSKLEDRVALELSRQGYVFQRQAPLRDPQTGRYIAIADFQLLDGRLIEVNGTFWHCDPRVYPNGPTSVTQIDGIRSDEKKAQALAKLGISPIILWELDLNADMPGTIERALALRAAI